MATKMYDKRYQVSDDGTITNVKTGCVLNPITDSKGYQKITVFIDKDHKRQEYVHIMVASLFVDKPANPDGEKLCVYHKDGNKANNCAANLGWKPFGTIIKDKHKEGIYEDHIESLRKTVFMINPNDGFSATEFNSFIEAAIYLKSINPDLPSVLSIRQNISAAFDNNRCNYAYGYIWKSKK